MVKKKESEKTKIGRVEIEESREGNNSAFEVNVYGKGELIRVAPRNYKSVIVSRHIVLMESRNSISLPFDVLESVNESSNLSNALCRLYLRASEYAEEMSREYRCPIEDKTSFKLRI